MAQKASYPGGGGSHYWNTPEAGGKVDKINLTQFGNVYLKEHYMSALGWMTFYASNTKGSLAMTTVSALKGLNYKYHPTAIVAIM